MNPIEARFLTFMVSETADNYEAYFSATVNIWSYDCSSGCSTAG